MNSFLQKFIILIFLAFSNLSLANEDIRLLVVGDSLSAGYGLPLQTGWVTLMSQHMASESLDIRVINDSISGDTTAGGLARIKKALKKHNPRWVIIELGANDGLRGQSLQQMQDNLRRMIELSHQFQAKPMLLGMKLPPNYGKRYTARFEQAYIEIASETETPFLPYFMKGVGGNDDLMQADGLHPNVKAQAIIANNVWQFVSPYLDMD